MSNMTPTRSPNTVFTNEYWGECVPEPTMLDAKYVSPFVKRMAEKHLSTFAGYIIEGSSPEERSLFNRFDPSITAGAEDAFAPFDILLTDVEYLTRKEALNEPGIKTVEFGDQFWLGYDPGLLFVLNGNPVDGKMISTNPKVTYAKGNHIYHRSIGLHVLLPSLIGNDLTPRTLIARTNDGNGNDRSILTRANMTRHSDLSSPMDVGKTYDCRMVPGMEIPSPSLKRLISLEVWHAQDLIA